MTDDRAFGEDEVAGPYNRPKLRKLTFSDDRQHLPKDSQRFLFYIFESGRCFSGLGKLGTQLNLNTWTVGNIEIPFPDIEIQKLIAAFLDRETARIDHLIAKKERMLDLLAEKKRSQSAELVTRGLNAKQNVSY